MKYFLIVLFGLAVGAATLLGIRAFEVEPLTINNCHQKIHERCGFLYGQGTFETAECYLKKVPICDELYEKEYEIERQRIGHGWGVPPHQEINHNNYNERSLR